jgi:hypothetical protein
MCNQKTFSNYETIREYFLTYKENVRFTKKLKISE